MSNEKNVQTETTEKEAVAALYLALGKDKDGKDEYRSWSAWKGEYSETMFEILDKLNCGLLCYDIRVMARLVSEDGSYCWKFRDSTKGEHETSYVKSKGVAFTDLIIELSRLLTRYEEQAWFEEICEKASTLGVSVKLIPATTKESPYDNIDIDSSIYWGRISKENANWRAKLINTIEYYSALSRRNELIRKLFEADLTVEFSEDGRLFKIPWVLRGYFLRVMYRGSPADAKAVDINKFEWVALTNRNLDYLEQALFEFGVNTSKYENQ